MQVKETDNYGSLAQYGRENVSKLGQLAINSMRRSGDKRMNKLAEYISAKHGISVEQVLSAKETLNVGETDLFTTAITNFVEARLTPRLVAAGVIKSISNFQTRGQNALKVPMRNALISATDLPDSGALTYDTESYTSTTITLGYKYASNSLTHEIVKFANVDLMAAELGEIGNALARKMDSDIISAFQTATTTANGNRTPLGTTTEVTFANLTAGLQSTLDNYAEPDVILCSPETAVTLINLSQFSGGSNLVGSMVVKGVGGENFPMITSILGMKLIVSQQVDNDDIYLIDSQRTGYLVISSEGVETFDGRRSGMLAYEVIGALNYGVGVVQPKSVYRLEENTV